MLEQAELIQQIDESIALHKHLHKQLGTLFTIAELLIHALQKGNKVLIFGNGGSAADAQHIASELAGKFNYDRDPLPAIALTTNTSSLTAISNDYGYEEVFARQIQGLAGRGDIVIGISTSGNSTNILHAMEEAKRIGAITIAFTGKGGKLAGIVDYVLSVPSTDTPRIQEVHITAGHIICYLVEETLFADKK